MRRARNGREAWFSARPCRARPWEGWIGCNVSTAHMARSAVPIRSACTAKMRRRSVTPKLRCHGRRRICATRPALHVALRRCLPSVCPAWPGGKPSYAPVARPAQQAVVEWRWNLRRLERLEHGWQTRHWASSGFDETGAQEKRGQTFSQAMRIKTVGRLDWLQRLHRSHGPERGPYSVCMHREDAATVSYTEITVSRKAATLRYTPGAPCCTAPRPALRLPLQSVPKPASISQWNGSARRAVARVR